MARARGARDRGRMKNSRQRAGAVAAFVLVLVGCSGSASPPALDTGAASTPPTITFLTVTPSTLEQTVAVPNTGGFTGTLTIGQFAPNTTGTVQITFAAGSSATLSAVGRKALAVRAPRATNSPIFQTQISGSFGGQALISGYVLNTPSNVNFPNGTYQATLSTNSSPPQGLTFVATGGQLTLVSKGLPLVVLPGQTVTLSVYAPGVTPLPTPSPTPSPGASPSPTPSPTATPTATPSPSSAGSVSISPSGCQNVGSNGGTITYTASAAVAVPLGDRVLYAWKTTQFPISIPPPTYNAPVYYNNAGTSLPASEATTATVTYPAYPQGSVYGQNNQTLVFVDLLAPDGSITPVKGPDGQSIYAQAFIGAGEVTCASFGM